MPVNKWVLALGALVLALSFGLGYVKGGGDCKLKFAKKEAIVVKDAVVGGQKDEDKVRIQVREKPSDDAPMAPVLLGVVDGLRRK